MTGSHAYFVHSTYSWFNRGGSYYNTYSGAFYFSRGTGTSSYDNAFRSSLS